MTSDLQEVITNEHVVAMMKAAINETEAVPAFVSPSDCRPIRVLSLNHSNVLILLCFYSTGTQNDSIQV